MYYNLFTDNYCTFISVSLIIYNQIYVIRYHWFKFSLVFSVPCVQYSHWLMLLPSYLIVRISFVNFKWVQYVPKCWYLTVSRCKHRTFSFLKPYYRQSRKKHYVVWDSKMTGLCWKVSLCPHGLNTSWLFRDFWSL